MKRVNVNKKGMELSEVRLIVKIFSTYLEGIGNGSELTIEIH